MYKVGQIGVGINSKTNFTRLFYFLRRRVSDDDETHRANSARKLCENPIGIPSCVSMFRYFILKRLYIYSFVTYYFPFWIKSRAADTTIIRKTVLVLFSNRGRERQSHKYLSTIVRGAGQSFRRRRRRHCRSSEHLK